MLFSRQKGPIRPTGMADYQRNKARYRKRKFALKKNSLTLTPSAIREFIISENLFADDRPELPA